jgi:hypothetical protein
MKHTMSAIIQKSGLAHIRSPVVACWKQEFASMSGKEVVEEMTSSIAAVIEHKKGKVPLTFAGAYEVAHSVAVAHLKAANFAGDDKNLHSAAHSTCLECYDLARILVASQFVGSTVRTIIEDINVASRRFPTSKENTAPDFHVLVQYPDRIDLWGLLSYAIAIRHLAYRELEDANANLDENVELIGVERAVQLLHMLTQGDILLSDIVERPFDGKVGAGLRKEGCWQRLQ